MKLLKNIINYIVVFSILVLFSSCGKSNGNGAKNYSKTADEISCNRFLFKEVSLLNNISKINSIISYDKNNYCFSVEDRIKTNIQTINFNENSKENVNLLFDYLYIIDCMIIENKTYLLYKNSLYDTYIAYINESGNIDKEQKCNGNGASIVYTNGTIGVWYIDKVSDNNKFVYDVILEKYDMSLGFLESVNVSSKLITKDNETICRLISDFAGNTWAEIYYDIKSGSEEEICEFDTKIIKFNSKNYRIDYEINDIPAVAGTDNIFANNELMIVYEEQNKKYINKYDKLNGKILNMYEIENAEDVFFCSDEFEFLYNCDNNIYGVDKRGKSNRIDDFNGEIVICHGNENNAVIVNEFCTQEIVVNVFNNEGENIKVNSHIIPNEEIIMNDFSVCNNCCLFYLENSISAQKRLLIIDENGKQKYCNIDINGIITDIEMCNEKYIYIVYFEKGKYNIIKYDMENEQMTDVRLSSDYDYIVLSCSPNGDIIFIGNSENRYCIYCSAPDNLICTFEIDFDCMEISFNKGYDDCLIFINTPNEIYRCTDNLEKITDIYDFGIECIIKNIFSIDTDKFIVYGFDYIERKDKAFIMEKTKDENKMVINAFVSKDIEKYVGRQISKFNNENADVFIKKINTFDISKNIPDIFIYNNDFEIYPYLNNSTFYNLKNIENNSEYFSFAFEKYSNSDYVYKFIPAFYVYDYETKESEFTVSDDDVIKKIILSDLEQYTDLSKKTCKFSSDVFYNKLDFLKNSDHVLFSNYLNSEDIIYQNTLIKFKKDAVIVPQLNISVTDNKNTDSSLEFLKTFLTDEYQNIFISSNFEGFPIKVTSYNKIIEEKELYSLETKNFQELFENITYVFHYNKNIFDIAYEEISEYSFGKQTKKETAENIDKKINYYFKELG